MNQTFQKMLLKLKNTPTVVTIRADRAEYTGRVTDVGGGVVAMRCPLADLKRREVSVVIDANQISIVTQIVDVKS